MPLNDTPCPNCGKRCHLMAGCNVLPQFEEHMFLVCWRCGVVRHPNPSSTWTKIRDAKRLVPKPPAAHQEADDARA